MKREKVISILHFCRDIDKDIKLNDRIIKNLEDQYYTTLGAVNMDGMPHASGGAASPVEQAVLNVPRSVTSTIDKLKRQNKTLAEIKAEIVSELNRLNHQEKAVIWGFYIEGQQWERISRQLHYSPRQCRNFRNRALDRLGTIFSQNEKIENNLFPEK